MNAFVAGLVPSDTVLVVTRGLLEKLSRQELQGVVAHEFSHIFNSDMKLNMRLIGILGGILALGQLGHFLLRSMRYSGRRRRSSSNSSNNQMGMVVIGAAVTLFVVGYVGLFFGRLIKAAISRQREFLADASAVQYSRDSMGIANALYRIKTNGKGSLLDSSHAEDMSHMCFSNALKFNVFGNMLATHPPLDQRIQTLVPSYRPEKQSAPENAQADIANGDALVSGFAAESSTADALDIRTSKQLVDQIGQLHPEQLAQAKAIHNSIPDPLIDAAHGSQTADLVILAVIAATSDLKDDQPLESLFSSIENKLTTEQIEGITELVPKVAKLAENLLIPLIEMTVPTLKQFEDQQKKDLLANTSLLIAADKKIKPFEFFLYALLRKNLSQKDAQFNSTVFRKYKPVLGDIKYVLSILVKATDNQNTDILTRAMISFDPKWQQPEQLPTYKASQLNKSLNRLNRLTPLLKRPIMQTLAEIVIHDGVVDTAELSLLRATGIYLEVPVPSLIS
ncbi:MAG: hypothetical protein DRQ47_03485 [Gammaproteobacteria bacterium]|nr:MAG: hypothetical protein DRQ47_03485 [Gammaproteobacteria bacterium]